MRASEWHETKPHHKGVLISKFLAHKSAHLPFPFCHLMMKFLIIWKKCPSPSIITHQSKETSKEDCEQSIGHQGDLATTNRLWWKSEAVQAGQLPTDCTGGNVNQATQSTHNLTYSLISIKNLIQNAVHSLYQCNFCISKIFVINCQKVQKQYSTWKAKFSNVSSGTMLFQYRQKCTNSQEAQNQDGPEKAKFSVEKYQPFHYVFPLQTN